MQRTTKLMAAVLALFEMQAIAMDLSQWDNLGALNPGDRIGIVQMNQKRIEGRYVRTTEDAITIEADQELTVAKQDVVRVYRRPGLRRIHRTIIGAAAGVAAGAILSATVGDRFRNEGASVPAGAWVGGGVAIGAGIGALSGGSYHEIYRRAPTPAPAHTDSPPQAM